MDYYICVCYHQNLTLHKDEVNNVFFLTFRRNPRVFIERNILGTISRANKSQIKPQRRNGSKMEERTAVHHEAWSCCGYRSHTRATRPCLVTVSWCTIDHTSGHDRASAGPARSRNFADVLKQIFLFLLGRGLLLGSYEGQLGLDYCP